MFLISSVRPISIGVYEDNKGATDQLKKPLSSSNNNYIDVRGGTISSVRCLSAETSQCSIFGQMITMLISWQKP